MGRHGFPMTRSMARCFIKDMIKNHDIKTRINLDKGPSDEWFRHFFQRHPQLTERKPQDQDRGRAAMSNITVMNQYFDMLEKVMKDNNLLDKPAQIFNCDETGWTGKETSRTKVIRGKDSAFTRRRVATSEHVTAHLCVCADGHYLPSMVIFKGSLPHRSYKDGIPDNWAFAHSESGYMDTEIFQQWFKQIFVPNCGRERPVLLVLDNHDSHISLALIETAIANNIVLLGLPAHTTHLLQPLDVKLIGPLKHRFSAIANSIGITTANATVGKAKFPVLLKHAIDQASPSSIQHSFSAAGLFPYKRNLIPVEKLTPQSFIDESDTEAVKTCETCGTFLTNPLVAQGLIPQRLASVLVPPPVKPLSAEKKRRVVSEARVLTGNEMLQLLKEKEENLAKKIEEKELRMKEKQERKEQKEKEIEEKQIRMKIREEERRKKKEIELNNKMKKLLGGRLAPKQFTCGVCGERGRTNDESNGINWYGCDERMCSKWYHEECLSELEREYVSESVRDGSSWYCSLCKPWLYEE